MATPGSPHTPGNPNTPDSRPSPYSLHLATLEQWLHILVASWLLLQTLTFAIQSFQWHMGEDVGFFYYLSWLINEQHFTPYIDIHETSFPGSFALYALLGKVGGYSHLAFNLGNVGSFLLCSALLFGLLKKIHTRLAIMSIALFGVFYFSLHHSMYLQRDYLAVLFILAAVLAMASSQTLRVRAIIAGVLFGMASSIKPHTAIGAPLVILLLASPVSGMGHMTDRTRPLLKATLFSLLGFCGVWAVIALALHQAGNLDAFCRMMTEYLPLYQRMNGIHLPLTTAQRLQNGYDWVSGTGLTLCLPALLGLVFVWRNPACTRQQKKLATLLLLLWLAYLVYVGIGGKFWDYHIIPANLFFACLLGLFSVPYVAGNRWMLAVRVCFLCVWLFYLWAMTPTATFLQAAGCLLHTRNDCAIDEADQYQAEDRLVLFLQRHLQPGERVEPYATSTLGPVFPALLRARSLPATPYLEGFPLYHDPDVAYIRAIRTDMLQRIQAHPPRFVIQPANFFAPGGSAASAFTELERFYQEHYQRVDASTYPELTDTAFYTVYEKKP